MKKFVGPAKKKKACKYRVCTSLKYYESTTVGVYRQYYQEIEWTGRQVL